MIKKEKDIEIREKSKKKIKEKDIEIREKFEEETEEESGLEEEVLEEDHIDQPRLQSFLSSKAPVLEKVAESAPIRTRFWTTQTKSSESEDSTESNGNSSKYLPSGEKTDEPKYISSSSHIRVNPEFVDTTQLGRTKFEPKIDFSSEASEMQQRGFSSSNVEKYSFTPERFDPSQEGRGDPYKREDKKYTPKLPSG